jgi:NADPH-dependent curcumin reductase
VTGTLGFNACIHNRSDDFARRLAKACPKGIDVYFEKMGGKEPGREPRDTTLFEP